MNKKILLSCIISTSLGYSVHTAHAQTDFDSWNDLGGFDKQPTTASQPAAPKLSIPDPKAQKEAANIQSQIDTNLKVETPKDIPSVSIPIPAAPEEPQTASSTSAPIDLAPEVTEKPKAAKTNTEKTKKAKVKPVEIKNRSTAKKITPKKRMTEDTSLSRVFEDNLELEQNYSPNGQTTRHNFENKTVTPKFFQRAEFDDNNKHLPTVVYQKRYSELLFAAIQKDDVGALHTLINNGADLNSRFAENGYTALMYAIQTKNLRTVRYLITKGANLNFQANDGKTALHLAAAQGDVEIFTALVKSGAKINVADYIGKSPLDYVTNMHRDQFETIVAQAEPDKINSLFAFVEKGSTKPVNQLLEQGADINVRDKNGDTPLIIAVRKNDLVMTNLLLNKGASTIVMNNTGEHALGIAQKNGNIELAKIIDTITIRRELESGVARRITQPAVQTKTEVQVTPNVTEIKSVEVKNSLESTSPIIQNEPKPIVDIESPKNLIVEVDSNQSEPIQAVEEETATQPEQKSFFSIFKKDKKTSNPPVQKVESGDGFFASMSKSINSISNRIMGRPDTQPTANNTSEIVSEALPEITQESGTTSIKPMIDVNKSTQTKLPSNIVKKTIIDGQEHILEKVEEAIKPSAIENSQPISIMPQSFGN